MSGVKVANNRTEVLVREKALILVLNKARQTNSKMLAIALAFIFLKTDLTTRGNQC